VAGETKTGREIIMHAIVIIVMIAIAVVVVCLAIKTIKDLWRE
jgi:hypothetical protein